MEDPNAWANLLNAISQFIEIHGLWVFGVLFFAIIIVGAAIFIVWFVIRTKNVEIERLVEERNKWQDFFIQDRKSSKSQDNNDNE